MDKSRLDDGSVLVGFELPAAVSATSVSVCGDFNGWSPDAHALALLEDGRFRAEIVLPAGQRWRFRYLVDGARWENDWDADDYVSNGLGADDCVVDLTEAGLAGVGLAGVGLAGVGLAGVAAAGSPATEEVRATDDATGSPTAERPTGRRWLRLRWWRRGKATLTPA